jgi:8-oxo-dGTP pyrophosphatase MutT (NUDIX family)
MLLGGGREEGEDELSCVAREVQEEPGLTVCVLTLMSDVPAEPPDGTYIRWRTYRCAVLGGEASPGGGEGANAELVDSTWLPMRDDRDWPYEIRTDTILYPQLQAIRGAVNIANPAP